MKWSLFLGLFNFATGFFCTGIGAMSLMDYFGERDRKALKQEVVTYEFSEDKENWNFCGNFTGSKLTIGPGEEYDIPRPVGKFWRRVRKNEFSTESTK